MFFDQIYDRALYCMMAAVLVVPELATFTVCLLMAAGLVALGGNWAIDLLRNAPTGIPAATVAE